MVAVVRGNGDDAAYSRLRAGYDSGDAELLKLFDDLAAKHLKVYAGTIAYFIAFEALLIACQALHYG